MTLSWGELSSQLAEGAWEKRVPYSMSFELTARCNQRCKMCYICVPASDREAQARELTAAQWLQLGREARDAGLFMVTLTGGEVFLRPDFREIYHGLLDLGLVVQIYTNGTLITPKIIDWLKQVPPLRVSITLYGASKETCAKVTGYEHSYERTVNAIDALREAGIPVEIKTTIVRENMHEREVLADFALARGLRMGLVNYISPRREGDCSDPEGNRLSPQELVDYEMGVIAYTRKMAARNRGDISFTDTASEVNPLAEDSQELKEEDSSEAFHCATGKCGGWISWDGRLLGCGVLSQPQAYPLRDGFLAAWEEIKQKCSQVPVCKECRECLYRAFCSTCPARLLSETGFYDRPAPYLCETARIRYESRNQAMAVWKGLEI